MDLNTFIDDLSSEKPAPGGGGASAMFGVLSAALSSMVCALTKGKKDYFEFEDFVYGQHQLILDLQSELMSKVEQDKQAYLQLNAAYKLPRGTKEEQKTREEEIQKALVPAATVPLEIMRLCGIGLDLTNSLIGKTTKFAVSDLGCAATGFKSALNSAWLNVKINLSCSKVELTEIQTEAKNLLCSYNTLADEIYKKVEDQI